MGVSVRVFDRYGKRCFGARFDWRWFKAQGMAERNLDSAATSRVGARGHAPTRRINLTRRH